MKFERKANGQIIIPSGFRILGKNEVIEQGDLTHLSCNPNWHPTVYEMSDRQTPKDKIRIYIRKMERIPTPRTVKRVNGKVVIPTGWYKLDQRQHVQKNDRFNFRNIWEATKWCKADGHRVQDSLSGLIYIRSLKRKQNRN